MDVATWLRCLGLERYEAAFRENEIDWEALPKLTAEDLKDLGVVLGSHRRRLLEAIVGLQKDVGPVPETVVAASTAERRQLTVMFCDLVGSTALSAHLDPEDLREVIAAYHRSVAGVVAQFDGFVAKYMGDGVLVYFGYPSAHEDDAERAVRAGLGIIETIGRLDVKLAELQARVGIATGLVVVGDLIGEGSAQEQSVVGETPNLAARLQALAEPAAVVIAASTRRLVGDLFEYRDLGAVEVKGIAGPVPAWQVLRPSAVASRFEATLNPSFAQGWYWSGMIRLWAGQPELAIKHFETSLRLSPHARRAVTFMSIGVGHFFARRFEDALAMLLRSLQERPSWVPTNRFLAACYAHMGRIDEAREVVARLRGITPLVIPNELPLRNPEHCELFLSGLRLAAGEVQ